MFEALKNFLGINQQAINVNPSQSEEEKLRAEIRRVREKGLSKNPEEDEVIQRLLFMREMSRHEREQGRGMASEEEIHEVHRRMREKGQTPGQDPLQVQFSEELRRMRIERERDPSAPQQTEFKGKADRIYNMLSTHMSHMSLPGTMILNLYEAKGNQPIRFSDFPTDFIINYNMGQLMIECERCILAYSLGDGSWEPTEVALLLRRQGRL